MLPEDTISVIMGIKYCRPELDTLRRSLDSILAQTYAEFELLICERGSSHLAKELLADYASRDPRVRVIDGSGAGSFSEQLNICLGQSRGAWIARMDDDDYSEPERFEKQLAYLRTHGGTAFVGCNVRLIQDGGDVGAQCFPENPQVRDFLFSMPFIHPALIFRREGAGSRGRVLHAAALRPLRGLRPSAAAVRNGVLRCEHAGVPVQVLAAAQRDIHAHPARQDERGAYALGEILRTGTSAEGAAIRAEAVGGVAGSAEHAQAAQGEACGEERR